MAAGAGPGDDVIVAQASAPGRSAVSVVRASGARAADMLRAIDRGMPGGGMVRGVRAASVALAAGPLPCVVACTPGPGSYTGEDSFELVVPGHPALVRMVLQALLGAVPGARLAGPGEFTLRAFAHARLTLEQAEGVAATIAARTDAELRAAAMLRAGAVGRSVHVVQEAVADLLALVEAGIDFTDQEDVVAIGREALVHGLRQAIAELTALVDGSVPLERLAGTPWVVLSGPANAGKSALFNALLGRPRAVVSQVAGTTRDALVEPWKVRGAAGELELLLVDAPGRLPNAQHLDALGQRMREQALQRACIVIECDAAPTADAPVADPALHVHTKLDDASVVAASGWLATSAHTGRGLQELSQLVAQRAQGLGASVASEAPVLAERHRALVSEAIAHLHAAVEAAGTSGAAPSMPELVAAALHGALESLGGIAGRLAPDDILGRVFGRFCVGK
jgi:tRNA modification GTPase